MDFSLKILPDRLEVSGDGRAVGTYHIQDPFKPHWHPLRSPAGHVVTLARPHDHLHHKGLMYALRTERHNFMEEVPDGPHEETGRQIHMGFGEIVAGGPKVSFVEYLEWRGGTSNELVFTETRRQQVSSSSNGGILLGWHSTLVAAASLSLIQSPWSRLNKEGLRINYHGLIIRLPRAWSGTGNHGFAADGVPKAVPEAYGTLVHNACYYGAMDGEGVLTFAAVTLRQQQNHRLCLRDEPFAWMTMGPSNGGPLPLVAGQVLQERYEVEITDGKPF